MHKFCFKLNHTIFNLSFSFHMFFLCFTSKFRSFARFFQNHLKDHYFAHDVKTERIFSDIFLLLNHAMNMDFDKTLPLKKDYAFIFHEKSSKS